MTIFDCVEDPIPVATSAANHILLREFCSDALESIRRVQTNLDAIPWVERMGYAWNILSIHIDRDEQTGSISSKEFSVVFELVHPKTVLSELFDLEEGSGGRKELADGKEKGWEITEEEEYEYEDEEAGESTPSQTLSPSSQPEIIYKEWL